MITSISGEILIESRQSHFNHLAFISNEMWRKYPHRTQTLASFFSLSHLAQRNFPKRLIEADDTISIQIEYIQNLETQKSEQRIFVEKLI